MKPPAEPAHPYTPQNQSGNAPQQEELSLAVQMVFHRQKAQNDSGDRDGKLQHRVEHIREFHL